MRASINIALFLAVFFSGFAYAEEGESKKIDVGVSIPLSGELAAWGSDIAKILEFANREIAGSRFNFVIEDDGCDNKKSVSIAHKLTSSGIKYVTGYLCSGALLTAAPVYEKSETLVIALGASSPHISNSGKYIFRTSFNDHDGARHLAQYLAHKGVSKLGVYTEENDYSIAFSESLKISADALGFQIVEERIAPGDKDIRSAILRMQTKDIEGIFINSQGEDGLLTTLKRIREFGIRLPIYSAYSAASRSFRNEAGILADGVEVLDLDGSYKMLSSEGQKLWDKYHKEVGNLQSVEWVFPSTVEAVRALKYAIDNPEDLPQSLIDKPFKGTLGNWFFDVNGDLEGWHFYMRRVEGRELVPVSK